MGPRLWLQFVFDDGRDLFPIEADQCVCDGLAKLEGGVGSFEFELLVFLLCASAFKVGLVGHGERSLVQITAAAATKMYKRVS